MNQDAGRVLALRQVSDSVHSQLRAAEYAGQYRRQRFANLHRTRYQWPPQLIGGMGSLGTTRPNSQPPGIVDLSTTRKEELTRRCIFRDLHQNLPKCFSSISY